MQVCTWDVVNSVSLDQAPTAVSAGTLIVFPDLFNAQIGAPFIQTGKVDRTSFGWRYTSPPSTLPSRSWEAYLPSPGSSAFARSTPGCDSHLLSFLFLTPCSDLCPTLSAAFWYQSCTISYHHFIPLEQSEVRSTLEQEKMPHLFFPKDMKLWRRSSTHGLIVFVFIE